MNRAFNVSFVLVATLILTAAMASAQGTAFKFQGQLKLDGKAANGLFDFKFSLYDGPDPIDYTLIDIVDDTDVEVNNGVFTATLDFGSGIFDGNPRWLWICVRDAILGGGFTCLDPLQEITPVPWATFAVNANFAENASTLDGVDSTGFLRRDTGCKICIGHADSNGSSPQRQQCFDLSSDGIGSSLDFSGDVDGNDKLWLWIDCP